MKKTDIGVVLFMYAVCGFFYYHLTKLKASSQTYPRFTIILLFALTTMYLVKMLIQAFKNGVHKGKDEAFKTFQPAQFFVSLGLVVLYVVMINFIGFYIATLIFMTALLLYLKVPKLHALIAVVAIMLLIYFAFGMFLKVKLPEGVWIKPLLKMLR
jgi:uncharacterized membrane protein YhdT